MNRAQPLWGEGLFLRPQHFQQQDAYADALNRRTLLLANPFAWGVRELDLDKEALASGILRLNRIDAVFSNGDSLIAPDLDQLPPPPIPRQDCHLRRWRRVLSCHQAFRFSWQQQHK